MWQVPLSLMAEAVRRWIATPNVQRAVNWGTGTILMLFAAFMLHDHVF
jgi:threonine/homoserine/homoserine lactone efflux protein